MEKAICEAEDCKENASYGIKCRLRCYGHREDGMTALHNKCWSRGCTTAKRWGPTEGNGAYTRMWCREHKGEMDIDLKDHRQKKRKIAPPPPHGNIEKVSLD